MKKITALLLTMLMLLSLASACAKQTETSTPTSPTGSVSPTPDQSASVGSEASTPTASPTPSQSETSTPSKEDYVAPSAFTLKGTKHLPIVDNQGGIGSCTSEGITYAQFTVAVSQYINHHYPEMEWDPSSGDPKYIFSPKFSYNYTTGNTSYCYRILVDDGCLPMSVSCFDKNPSYPGFWGGSILDSEKTRSWDVGEGMMLSALNYRLTNYTEQGAPSSITSGSDPYVEQVKEAISRGNAVTVCGASYNWMQMALTEQPEGCLAKEGENVIWKAATTPYSGPSGHCVALVGYDDNVTLRVGGAEMKGAFLMMNSWGDWANDGFVWVMYDACNTLSECFTVSSPAYANSGIMALDPNVAGFYKSFSYVHQDYLVSFTPVDTVTISGQEYTTYYLSNSEKTTFISYKGGTISTVKKPDKYCLFAFPTYASVNPNAEKDFDGANTVAAYAVHAPGANKYLRIEEMNGRAPSLTSDFGNQSYTAFRIHQDKPAEDGSFIGIFYTASTLGGTPYTREKAFDSYGFVYWDEDVTVGMPKLSVEVKVETLNRKTLYMTLNKTDGNGNTETFVPAMMQIRINEGADPETGGGGDRVSFSGKLNPTEREEGYFTFGYLPLTDFSKDSKLEDYLWGISARGSGVVIKQIRLYDENKNLLAEVQPNHDAEPLVAGQQINFALQLNSTPKTSAGSGFFSLKTDSLFWNFSTSEMAFVLSEKDIEKSRARFHFIYNSEADGYEIKRYDDKYLLDITGKAIKEGTTIKFNKVNPDRNTQLWEISQQNGTGPVKIALKADPSYVIAPVNGQLCITQNAPNDGYVWFFTAAASIEMPIRIGVDQNGKTVLSATSENEIRVYKNGTLVKALNDPKKEGDLFLYDLSDLSAGNYCFTMYKDGKPIGLQIGYKI